MLLIFWDPGAWYWVCVMFGSIFNLSVIVHGLGQTIRPKRRKVAIRQEPTWISKAETMPQIELLRGHLTPGGPGGPGLILPYLRRPDDTCANHQRRAPWISTCCLSCVVIKREVTKTIRKRLSIQLIGLESAFSGCNQGSPYINQIITKMNLNRDQLLEVVCWCLVVLVQISMYLHF
jgi:hypothetical protein